MHNIQQTDAHIVVTTQSMKWKKNIQGCGFLFGADIVAAVGMSWYEVGAEHSPVLAADMWICGWYVVDMWLMQSTPPTWQQTSTPLPSSMFSHTAAVTGRSTPQYLLVNSLHCRCISCTFVHVEHCWTHLSVEMMLRLMINRKSQCQFNYI